MDALSAADVLYAWEVGQRKHPVDRALLLLSLALPALSLAALNVLTVGERNALLLLLRQQTLGPLARCMVRCPHCGEQLEFTLDSVALLPPGMSEPSAADEPAESVYELTIDDVTLRFRLPTSVDLASVVSASDAQEGRQRLIASTVTQAQAREQPIAIEDLPEPVVQALAEAVLEHDPLAEIPIALDCAACGQHWTALFDIVAFFWAELDALAKRLLRDVHTIASAYGWRESDILALSASRRQAYLELIR